MSKIGDTLGKIALALGAINAIWVFLGFGFIALPFAPSRSIGILLIVLIIIVAFLRIWINYFKGEEILKGLHFKKEEYL
jgi:hypothetical protein